MITKTQALPKAPACWSIHLQVLVEKPKMLDALKRMLPGFGGVSPLYLLVHKMFMPIAESLGVRIVMINVVEGPLPDEVRP